MNENININPQDGGEGQVCPGCNSADCTCSNSGNDNGEVRTQDSVPDIVDPADANVCESCQ